LSFNKAFALTAIAIVLLSLLSTAGAVGRGSEILYFAWYVAAVVWVMALGGLVVLVSLRSTRRREIVSGVLAGMAVGVLALAATCFANLNTFNNRF
jgi:hypothetical protein